jgi:hypothetical protein
MDANDEGSEPEPGPGAPGAASPGGAASEGAAPERAASDEVTGVTSSPGDPASGDLARDEPAADEPAADAPRTEAVVPPESERTETEAVAPVEPEETEFGRAAVETVASAESEGTEPEPAVSAESQGAEPQPAAPAEHESGGPRPVASAEFDETEPEAIPWAGSEAGSEAGAEEGSEAPAGLAALSLRYQIAAALALAVVAVVSCVHLGMVFLHVAPSNTVTKRHGRAIDEWIYPEFEQNWKLFAPNPLQQDITVQVRALVRTADGTSSETGWYDLSALDGLAIDGNPLPSHTQQNELRRAWDFYAATHDSENRPAGLRGDLSERYLRRIGVLRLDREHAGGEGAVIERVQFRSLTTNVPPPAWSDEKVSDQPVVRELPWWAVPESDRADGLTEASAR